MTTENIPRTLITTGRKHPPIGGLRRAGRREACRGFDKKKQWMVNSGMGIDWKRIKRSDVAMTLLQLLHAMGGEQQGYKLMDDSGIPYRQAKLVLQNLRQDGVVVVVADGPPGKRTWIAHQRLALCDEAFKHFEESENEVDKTMDDARRLAAQVNGRKMSVGVGWLDNPHKRAVLRMAVSMGWVGLRVEGKAHEG